LKDTINHYGRNSPFQICADDIKKDLSLIINKGKYSKEATEKAKKKING
jgi:hypothetical protein